MAAEPLTLASRSPQRRAILEQLGVEFRVVAPEVEELTEGDPREVALENALRKARAVEGERVLGVDTEVVLDGRVFGKPGERARRRRRSFARLSGRMHEVVSGDRAPSGPTSERSDVAVTRVRFRDLDEHDLAWYLASGEWRDRAGGYAIQGRGRGAGRGDRGRLLERGRPAVPLLLELAPDLLK